MDTGMKWMPSLGGPLENKADAAIRKPEPRDVVRRATSSGNYFTSGVAYRPFWDTDRLVSDAYERTALVWACINAIASDESSLPIVFRKNDPDQGELIEDHMHLDLLNISPNSFESAKQFRYRLVSLLYLSRQGVMVEKVRTGGRVTSLTILPVGRTFPIPDSRTWVSGFEVWVTSDGAETITVPARDVMWFKRPHPTDPYLSQTPLQAAGISIDMAYFARLYNRNFMANDGRPGGILAIKGQVDDEDATILKSRLSGGPGEAGRTIAIEADDLSYIDLAVNPRDAQYVQTTNISRDDILTAMGVPESRLGKASGSTFANASQEELNYWRSTMRDVDALLDDVFTADPDIGAGLGTGVWSRHDTSSIAVLQQDANDRNDRLLKEWEAGLITADEYRQATGRTPFNRPLTRALLVAPRFAVGRDDADMHEIAREMVDQTGLTPTDQLQQALDLASQQPAQGSPSGDDAATSDSGSQTPSPEAVGASPDSGEGQKSVEASIERAEKALALLAEHATKAAVEQSRDGRRAVAARTIDGYEVDLTQALQRLVGSQESDALRRLASAKVRQGTKHWIPAPVEVKALDTASVFSPGRWLPEAIVTLRPLVARMFGLSPDEAVADDTDQPPEQPEGGQPPQPSGHDGDGSSAAILAVAAAILAAGGLAHGVASAAPTTVVTEGDDGSLLAARRAALTNAMGDLIASMQHQAAQVAEQVSAADALGQSMDEITAAVETAYARQREIWTAAAARHVVTGAVNEAAMLSGAHEGLRVAEWLSSHDEKVRPTHRAADGQRIDFADPAARFIVGGVPLRFPGDPSGPPSETANCRCTLLLTRGTADDAKRMPVEESSQFVKSVEAFLALGATVVSTGTEPVQD